MSKRLFFARVSVGGEEYNLAKLNIESLYCCENTILDDVGQSRAEMNNCEISKKH